MIPLPTKIAFLQAGIFFVLALLVAWKKMPVQKVILLAVVLLVADYGYRLVMYWFELRVTAGTYFLPPQSQIFLIEGTVQLRPILAAVFHAGLWFVALWQVFLRHGGGTMLDLRDVQWLTLGLLAVGWPAGLLFLGAVFLLSVIGMVGLVLLKRKSVTDRLVITPYIFPAAILVLLWKIPLLELTHLIKIRF